MIRPLTLSSKILGQLTIVAVLSLAKIAAADHGGSTHMDLNLASPATSNGSYTVTWDNTASNTYELQEKFNSGAYSVVYTGTATSKLFSGKPAGTFAYRVHYSFLFFGNTVHWYTDAVSTTVAASGPSTPSPITGPSSDGDGAFSLSWGSSTGAAYYELHRQQNGGSWVAVQSTSAVTFNELGLTDGTYNYKVRACDATTCSGWTASKVVTVSMPPSLDGLTSAPAEVTSGLAVGNMPYGLDVGANGDAVISIPLQLIPGVAGFGPSLGVVYESGRGVSRLERSLPEDTLGYGWRTIGLSQLRRCVVDQASGSSISLTSSDSLCLDGMPLVLASGTHFAVGAIYRTQIESYTKIEIKGALGALWFKATLPDGTVVEYGNGSGGRVSMNGGTDYQWSIGKETSVDGNVIDYSYVFDSTNGINYILNINYSNADVGFEYLSRTDAAAVPIGNAAQTQSVFLHTIRVSYNSKNVREYRLLNEVASSRRRLNKIQHCGYDEAGVTASCLGSLDFDWLTPSATMAGVDILVDGMIDSLNAVHQIEYGAVTGSTHPFLFTERPFGNGSLAANTQLLFGSGALRHVTTRLRRDNGLGGFHDTTYAYQDKGLESTKHWGFLGFYAQRVKDEQSGIVTYIQYRMEYPYFGSVARLHQFDGVYPSHTQTLTRSESDFAQQVISHSVGTTVIPYANSSINFVYEGTTQLGASKSTNILTFSNGFVSQVVSTSESGTGVSTGSSGGSWGDIPTYTLSNLKNTSESTVAFTNRTTSGQWLINFPNTVTNESWPGVASGVGIVRDATLNPETSSVRPVKITGYPNDANLLLETDINYDPSGRAISAIADGGELNNRVTSILSFEDNRYPGQVRNSKGQITTFSNYDSRFGAAKTRGNPNGRNTSWVRDSFGRVISTTNGDGVVTTTSYTDCPSGCGVTVYGVSPSFYVQTDSIVTPVRKTYFDSLGRVIRTGTESFSGSSFSKVDIKYDTQGRIEKSSLPYFSGTSNDFITIYDIRNRVSNVSRPDGSSVGTVFSVSSNTVVVTITDNVKKANGASAGTQVKRNEYDILGRLAKTTDGYGTSTNPSTSYTYDANFNVLTVIVNGGVAGSTTTTFEYDVAGNQKKIIGPDIGTVTSTYNGFGEVTTRLDNKGQLFTHSYDVLGRLTKIVSPDGTSDWVWDTATNGVGQLKSRSNAGFAETYSYNGTGRLSSVVTGITPIGGASSTNYTTSHVYDTYGRPTSTSYPGGFSLSRVFNARGYLSQLKDGAAAIQTVNDLDAFGNSVDESFANGVDTLRTFDPETGRLTDVNTTKGSTVFQNNDYAWRSNGTLESRIANPANGLNTTRKESYVYDVLNRVTLAETHINGSNTRDLAYVYDQLGNIKSKTSTLTGDTDVTGYSYGAGTAGPHAATNATVGGLSQTLSYDLNGAVTKYDIAGSTDDKYIAYNAYNQPTTIVLGTSLTDATPQAKDEFAYDPNGQRYARKSTWQEGGNTITEEAAYIGAVEIIADDADVNIQTVTKTQLSGSAMHVKIEGAVTETFFEYAHRDHLGSTEIVTDENGNTLDNLAFEPFGMRKEKDWTANISSSEFSALLDLDSDHSRKARGFTGHEHLDRTGFIHMNGRVYDPVLGRFLSPDPFVQFPAYSQSWNRYSYLNNTPTSFTDPSGYEEEPLDEIVTRRQRLDTRSDGSGQLNVFFSPTPTIGGSSNGDPGSGERLCSESPGCIVEVCFGLSCTPVSTPPSTDDGPAGIQPHPTAGVLLQNTGTSTSGDRMSASVREAIKNSSGIAQLIGDGLNVLADVQISAFSGALFGQPYRHARVARLSGILKPLKLLGTKIGIAGLIIEVGLGINTFMTTGNPIPLFVAGVGFGASAVIASYSAPGALAFAVSYSAAGYFGFFDSDSFD